MYEDYLSKALSNIIMAKQAIKAFQLTNNKDMKNGASYHAQQAIEFIIKYEIYNTLGRVAVVALYDYRNGEFTDM